MRTQAHQRYPDRGGDHHLRVQRGRRAGQEGHAHQDHSVRRRLRGPGHRCREGQAHHGGRDPGGHPRHRRSQRRHLLRPWRPSGRPERPDQQQRHGGPAAHLKPYGETHTNQGSVDFDQRRFTGQIQDPETGLYFYNARYYNPALGRFISPDPIVPEAGNPQALNRYTYVDNNPVILIDPSGHFFSSERQPPGPTVGVLTAGPSPSLWGLMGRSGGDRVRSHEDPSGDRSP